MTKLENKHHKVDKNEKYLPAIFIVLVGVGLYVSSLGLFNKNVTQENIPVTFECAENKSIRATFSGKIVSLELSDGRNVVLDVSLGNAGKYINPDGTFAFWIQGKTAVIEEGKSKKATFKSCSAQ